jgi:1-acyl-sn-glycerol-3-phosphate acyltransferase
MTARLLSTALWVFAFTSSAVLFPVAVVIWAVTFPFDRRGVVLHRFTCFWASLYSWVNPSWQISIEGREHLSSRTACLMVSNHQSTLDILVLFRLFVHFKWVAKAEAFRVPFIGWNMWLNRYVPLRRTSRRSIVEMMAVAEQTLRSGSSVMMFPEGTRSPDGKLQAFKQGAFSLAKRAEVPILPIVLEGTGSTLPKRGFVSRGQHRIRVRVLPPISHESFAETPVAEVAARVQALYRQELAEPD